MEKTIGKGVVLADFKIAYRRNKTIHSLYYYTYMFGKWKFIDTLCALDSDPKTARKELNDKAVKKWGLKEETLTIINQNEG